MRSNEITEALVLVDITEICCKRRKDEMDKTRTLTMGILWRRADTELELNEKR